MRGAVTLQFFGAIFRCLSIWSGWFWPVLFGTILQACAAPFIINSQIVICNKWFADNERALATALMSVSLPIGTAVAFMLTTIYFGDTSKGKNIDNLNNMLFLNTFETVDLGMGIA